MGRRKKNDRAAVFYGTRRLAEGVEISNDIYKTGLNNNDLVIGGSGSGKTSGPVAACLADPYGSIIVTDTKGQLYKRFSEYLKGQGYVVKLIDFVNPERSMAYNPLDYIRRYDNGYVNGKDVHKLATALAACIEDKEDRCWYFLTIDLLSLVICYLLEKCDKEIRNMEGLVRIFGDIKTGDGWSALEDYADEHPNSATALRFALVDGYQKAVKMWASVLGLAGSCLAPFSYGEFRNVLGRRDEVDIKGIGEERTAVFLNVSDSDTSFHILTNIFYTQAFQTLMDAADRNDNGRLTVPTRFIFDDFAASPKIDDFDNVISVIRSRDISVTVNIQSMSQLYSKYGRDEGHTIMNNCAHWLVLEFHDPDTEDYVARVINKPVGWLQNISKDEVLVLSGGDEPILADKLKIYTVPDVQYGD